jgi:cell division protein FtsB
VEQATDSGRNMNKIAMFISLAAVILLLGLYMHLNQSLTTLNRQVQDLSAIKTTVSTLDTKINTMETRVADLETLPAQTRAALMSSILQEMSQKTSYMSTQLDSPEQQDKLMRAKELIQQVQTELSTGK